MRTAPPAGSSFASAHRNADPPPGAASWRPQTLGALRGQRRRTGERAWPRGNWMAHEWTVGDGLPRWVEAALNSRRSFDRTALDGPIVLPSAKEQLVRVMAAPLTCVYRKLKLGRSGGEVRQGWRVI
jgi:hypothetical protein